MTLDEKIAEAHAIIDRAIVEHQPKKIISLFSGGDDSFVTTHVASRHPAFSGVAHIDTGIAVTEGGVSLPRKFVEEVCAAQGWPLYIYRTHEDYDRLVLEHGFPGPALHYKMYQRLKDRCVYKLLKEHKAKRLDRIGLVSGIRRQESQRRMGYNNPVQRYRSQIWINALFFWTADDLAEYRQRYALARNPVKETLGMSGECLCGAYAKKGELDRICQHYPETGQRIIQLQERVKANGFDWGWEEGPPRGQRTARAEVEGATAFQPLCTSCNFRAGQVTAAD